MHQPRSCSESPKSIRMYLSTSPRPLDYCSLYYDSMRKTRRRHPYSSSAEIETREEQRLFSNVGRHINTKRSYSVTDDPYNVQDDVFVSETLLPEHIKQATFTQMATTNSHQTGIIEAGTHPLPIKSMGPVLPRHHASFSEPSSSTPNPPQFIRRESMTRLFLKPNAVFKAYEEEELRQQEQQKKIIPVRVRRYTSIEDESILKTISEPDILKDAPESTPTVQFNKPAATSEPHPPRIQRSTSINQEQSPNQFSTEARRRCSVFVAMESLKKEDPDEVYTINKQLGTGRFGYVKLAEHKASKKTVALKFFPRPQIKQANFLREYNFSRLLSPHHNIIDTFNGVYQAVDDSAYYFVQEFAPHASLREMVEANAGGIGEAATKSILLSVVSAVDFMHTEKLVHRNLKAENILIFSLDDFSKVKITDFGLTRKEDSTVKNLDYTNVYHAPELVDTVVNEFITVEKPIDIWALGIIFYYCLRGKFPWSKASIICKPYFEWDQWMRHKAPHLPRRYDVFTEKAIKLQKRCLVREKDRYWTCKDIKRYLEKERLMKPAKTSSKSIVPDEPGGQDEGEKRNKSTIHGWISSSLKMVTEISEQVVSARDA